ncbi:hypothetical protein EVAR_54102_1 [Eumeta japonica]|uniref:Uncharacterized protein n=1 Tax=Eumeta variegata TaxID=151549 RepID=A0A4C1Z212_EUMVA|nr:hypothetical protein EVAR_54102_1 [Eumeta japonica]
MTDDQTIVSLCDCHQTKPRFQTNLEQVLRAYTGCDSGGRGNDDSAAYNPIVRTVHAVRAALGVRGAFYADFRKRSPAPLPRAVRQRGVVNSN